MLEDAVGLRINSLTLHQNLQTSPAMTRIKATVVHTFGEPLTIEVPARLQTSFAAIAPVRCAGAMVYKGLRVMRIAEGV